MKIEFSNYEYRKVPRRHDMGLVTPPSGKIYRLKHDMELAEYNYQPRQFQDGFGQPNEAVPSTRRFKARFPEYPDFMTVSDAWAWRWVEMIHWSSDHSVTWDEAKQIWRGLIQNRKAFTDNHAPENGYRDPVTGENPNKPNIMWGNVGMTGNIVKRLPDGRIEAFDPAKPPPPLEDIISQSWKWHWATEIRPDGVVSNFPDIEDVCGSVCNIPVPLFGKDGWLMMKLDYLDPIGNGVPYDVYAIG